MGRYIDLKRLASFTLVIIVLILLYLCSIYNYLLFHSFTEIFSIGIAFTVFLVAWNSSKYVSGNYLQFIGTAYLFIAILDLLHTISYKGMHVFLDYDYYANQIWIATRYMESITLLLAFAFIDKMALIKKHIIFVGYFVVTSAIVVSIFYWNIFPVCFIEDVGLTPFKKISEYIISFILLISIFFIRYRKRYFDVKVYRYLMWSIVFTIGSELAFTFYIDNYGFSNLVGHYFKIISFYLIYKAIIEKGIREPFETIFRELKENELKLSTQNNQLRNLAIIDSLTGLFNHRYLYDTLEKEIARSNRYGSKLAVILLDIDNFKHVNDYHGHVVGDKILNEIAKVIKDNIRSSDVAGRYGGDEIMIILPETNHIQGHQTANKIRVQIESSSFVHNDTITISAGVVEYSGEKASELVQKADQKLYEAKKLGKNRIQM